MTCLKNTGGVGRKGVQEKTEQNARVLRRDEKSGSRGCGGGGKVGGKLRGWVDCSRGSGKRCVA